MAGRGVVVAEGCFHVGCYGLGIALPVAYIAHDSLHAHVAEQRYTAIHTHMREM